MTTYSPLGNNGRTYVGFWFDAEGVEASRRVFETVRTLRHEQIYVAERQRMAMQLYGNVIMPGITEGYEAGWQFGGYKSSIGPYGVNIVKSMVDTIHAEIISNRVKVQVITDGGSWDGQQKAKQQTKFIAGVFDDVKMTQKTGPLQALHALIYGSGFVKWYVDEEGRIQAYNTLPMNIVFDDVEAASGYTSSIFEERLVSRHTLAKDFEGNDEAAAAIMSAPEVTFPQRPQRNVGDLIRVIETWQPAYGKSDGRRVLVVSENAPPIVDEVWKNKKAPFTHLKFGERLDSILGSGVPDMICGHQEVINDLREKINAQIMGASPFVWTMTGSKLKECHISNELWRVIESDVAPQHIAFASVPQDLFNQLQAEKNEAMEMVGVNQTMMHGEIPAGLSSGRAQLVYNDTRSKRFTKFMQAYENMHTDSADTLIDIFEDLADAGAGYETGYRGDDGLEKINYKEIRLPRDAFYIRKYPSNFLSDTSAGRIQQIEYLANISPELKPYLVGLIQNPDVEFATSRLSVQTSSAQRIAEKLLTTDTEVFDCPPIPEMNLQQASEIMKNYIVDATSRNVPDERIQKCRDWLRLATDMLNAASPQEVPQQTPPSEPMGMETGMPPAAPSESPVMQ